MVNNFTVTLTDENGNTRTAKTNRSGVYTFDDLAPGQYTVSATANRGLAFTRTGDGNILRNLSGGAGESEPVALTMGADLTGLDIGMITPDMCPAWCLPTRTTMACATRMKAACSARWFT